VGFWFLTQWDGISPGTPSRATGLQQARHPLSVDFPSALFVPPFFFFSLRAIYPHRFWHSARSNSTGSPPLLASTSFSLCPTTFLAFFFFFFSALGSGPPRVKTVFWTATYHLDFSFFLTGTPPQTFQGKELGGRAGLPGQSRPYPPGAHFLDLPPEITHGDVRFPFFLKPPPLLTQWGGLQFVLS